MNKSNWIATATLGLTLAAPSVAHAHGQFLEGINGFVDGQIAAPACDLPGMTCGICHQPLMGDRLENITVGFGDIDPMDRNGPFYDSLMANGWNHLPHMMDGNAHRDQNLMDLTDTVLPAMLGMGIDSDGDGVPDLEELSLGYNPLLAYEEADPARSQICDQAEPFPDVGGTSGSTGGDTTGGPDPDTTGDDTTGNGTTGGSDPDTTGDGSGGNTTPGESDSNGTATGGTGGGTTTDSGAADGGDDEGGCGCRTSNPNGGLLSLLLGLGLVVARRRRR